MSELQEKRVLILQQRRWARNIGHFLATKLQSEGCSLAALTLKRTTHEFILAQKEVRYDLIINNDEIMGDPAAYLNGDKISLEQVCEDLGIDSVWPIVMSLRNFAMSYKEGYYYDTVQNVPDEGITDYVKATYKYIRRIFNEFNPQIILTPNFVALPHIMLMLYAKKRGVKMVGVTDSKVKGVYIFSYSPYDNEGKFFEHLQKLNAGSEKSPNASKARDYISEFRDKFKQPSYFIDPGQKKSLYKKLRHELSPLKEIWAWYTKPQKNYLKSTGITGDYKPPRIILRDFYWSKYYTWFANRFNYYSLEKVDKCIYYPLQFQPEASIDVIAPYFSNQLEVARQIAISLPDDYTLVVKDHPAMLGLRRPSHLKKLARTPNVKLIDYRIKSEVVLKKAGLVISPNSTSLAEAAFYCKPAIQFGDLGTTLALPNVFKHSDMTTLIHKVKELLTKNLKNEEYERRLQNYIAASFDMGMNFDYISIWEEGKGDKEQLWAAYKKEILSLI